MAKNNSFQARIKCVRMNPGEQSQCQWKPFPHWGAKNVLHETWVRVKSGVSKLKQVPLWCSGNFIHVELPVNINIKFWNVALLLYWAGVTTSVGTTSKIMNFNFFIGFSFTLVCLYVCMYVCMHVCMYACIYECIYACIYVFMYMSIKVLNVVLSSTS